MEGVSCALRRKLELSEKAVDMMRISYERLSIEYQLNEFRLKMAMLPKGSIPLQNIVGIAPAVMIEVKSTTHRSRRRIFCLPGVPMELEGIFSIFVIPILKKEIGRFNVIETTHEVIGVGESFLAPVLLKIKESSSPQSVYVKTHPKGYTSDHKPVLQIQIVCKGEDRKKNQSIHNETFSLLMDEIERLKGKVVA